MIDERGLLSAMKSTWRSEGYTVAGYREDGERVLCIHGASWLVAIPYSAISRKVLALLVEHLGEIPDGAAWTVRKGEGVQGQIMDVVLTRLDGLRRHIEEGEEDLILRSSMRWKGYEVWQRPATLKVTAYDPVLLCGESCHRNGPRAAHRCKETALALHQYGQRKYMEEQDATVEDFRREFGRNYL